MSRQSEQGNVPVFVIVGILLTAALVGAVVIARNLQHSTTVPATPKIVTSDSGAQKSTSDTTTDDQALKDALTQQSQRSDTQSSSGASSSEGTSSAQQSSPSSGSTPSTTTTTSLPKTGPESTLVSLLGACLLVGTSFAYARSRRLV